MRSLRFVIVRGFALLVLGALFPAAASAQSSLAGVAKDTSGAVLPGVTVEAASPALIEKVRSVTTDTGGQFKIVDLRPGTYTLTFTLTGFSVVKREGIELGGSGTVTVNADMKVGTLAETITVTGETPIVDVQNAARQQVLDGNLVARTPAAKSWNGIMLLVPGVTGDPNTVQLTPGMVLFGIHGGPATEGRLQVDGMNVGASRGGGGVSGYSVDTANVQEVTFRTSGGLGEAETGGPYMNIVPKTGGNTFRGSTSFQFSNSSLQSDNYDDFLRSKLSAPSQILSLYDVDGALGGPIKKDKLWFFYLGRTYGNGTSVTGIFANKNAGNPNSWSYDPDKTLQARNDGSTIANGLRLTWQISQKNKLNLFWDSQQGCAGAAWIGTSADACRQTPAGWIEGGTSSPFLIAPEGGVYGNSAPQRIQQVTWTNTMSSKMLFEFGYSGYNSRWGGPIAPGNPTADFIQVREQGGSIPGLCYRVDQHAVRRRLRDLDRLDLGEHLARQRVVRDRRAQHQVRLQRSLRLRQPGFQPGEFPGPGVPVQQRRPEPDLGALGHLQEPVAHALQRVLRAGLVDGRQADGAGRAAVRACLELLPGVVYRRHAVHPDVYDHSSGGWRKLQRHPASSRCRL